MIKHEFLPLGHQNEPGFCYLHQKIDECWQLIFNHRLGRSERLFKALCFLMAIGNHDALLSPKCQLALAEVEDFPIACGKSFDQLDEDDLLKMESKLIVFLRSV